MRSRRFSFGDTINTSARHERANKQLGTRICASASLAERAASFRGRPVGDLVLRGKAETLRAYELLSEEAYADPATALYLDAFGKLEARDPAAMQAFAALVGLRPGDSLASFHLRRLLNGSTGVRIELRTNTTGR